MLKYYSTDIHISKDKKNQIYLLHVKNMSRISFQLLFHLLMKWSNCKGDLKQTDQPPCTSLLLIHWSYFT